MRLTDDQIVDIFFAECVPQSTWKSAIVSTVRRCLALAAMPDTPSDYNDVERRGFEVTGPGGLPK